MARHVFDTPEVAHLWAHRAQDDGRNAQGNFYFRGDTIYSYGSHFPIARHVTNKAKQRAILFTTLHSSITTARQMGIVRGAIPASARVLFVADPEAQPAAQMQSFAKSISYSESQCFGATGRFRPSAWKSLERLIAQANEFAEFFGLRKRWTLPETPASVQESIERGRKRQLRLDRKIAKAAREAAALRAKKQAGLLRRWRKGEAISTNHIWDCPASLRIVGDTMETSKGATIPMSHAVTALAFVRQVVARGKAYQRNGHTIHVGVYALDAIDPQGNVTAGCHHFEYKEIQRIAPQVEAWSVGHKAAPKAR